MELGKKLYKSTSILTIKLLSILVSLVLLINLYFLTFYDPDFIKRGLQSASAVIEFNLFYPENFLFYLLLVLAPALYYAFIRGTSFYENGVIINKGLPFFNVNLPYESIENFQIIHPKFLLSIKRKDTEDEILFSVSDVDRVVAIFDQNGIKGDLGNQVKKDFSTHRKLIYFFIISGILVYLFQYFEVARLLFR